MRLMDVAIAYLYGTLENDIYMKIPKGLKFPEALKSTPREMCSIKLQISLYGLKQSSRMWYNRLSEYLKKEGYKSDVISPCVFIKRSLSNFTIIAFYVDDIRSLEDIEKAAQLLKKQFEMKDLGMTELCIRLQFEYMCNGTFVHQSNYIQKMLVHFNIDKAHPFSVPMVVRPLDPHKDPYRPQKEGEEELGPEVPYLSVIGVLMYLANNTRLDIAFAGHKT
ncbi:putative RNA-directed DNA polymerase [Helianthus annuus]|nr:putative RNA-directed DNA polymerase [Helianthus annuus]